MTSRRLRPGRLAAPALAALSLLLAAASCGEDITGRRGSGEVRVLWRQPLSEAALGLGVPTADGGRVYAPFRGVSAWDAGSGRLLWERRLAAYAPRNVVARGGRLYAAETAVFALGEDDGRVLWRVAVDSAADFARSVADDEALYVGTRDHRVHALRLADGARMWSTDVGPGWEFRGLVGGIAVSGDTVYATAERFHAPNGYRATGILAALDRATGRLLWTYENGDGSDLRNFSSSPVVAGRLLLASDLKGNAVVAVDRFTGREAWRVDGVPGFVGFQLTPEVRGDTAYAASGDRFVYAIRVSDGRVVWKTQTPAANNYFAVCGDVVLANYQGVAVIDRHTGQLRSQMLDGDDEFASSGFAVEGRRAVVFGNKAMYGLDCG